MSHPDRARRRFVLASTLALASALGAPRPARAQADGERAAAAQALFDEAMRLMKAEQTAAACPKLEESQRLDPGMGTEFRLAECYEKIGKVASAWAKFVSVADSAAVAHMPERETVARQRAQALVPKLPKLSVSVPRDVAATPGLEVQRDGVVIGPALWEVAVPVDPGEHVVSARAPGKRAWEGKVTVTPAAAPVYSVTVQPLADLPQGPAQALPPGARQGRSAAPAIALGGLAVVGLGLGAALFVEHSSAASDAESLSAQIKAGGKACGASPDPRCSSLADKASSADTLGNASIGAFVAAGALGLGAAAYLLWPTPAPTPTSGAARPIRIHLRPVVGQGVGALFVDGSF